MLNDDEGSGAEAGQFFPGISIAPIGRVDIAWYDGRLGPAAPPEEDGGAQSGFQDVVPGWAWLGAGTAMGLGLAAVVAWLVARRSESSARGPAGVVAGRG